MLTMFEDRERDGASWSDTPEALPKAMRMRTRNSRAVTAASLDRKWGRYKYWTRADVAELRKMAGEGARVVTIARHFNLSVRAIRKRAARECIAICPNQHDKKP